MSGDVDLRDIYTTQRKREKRDIFAVRSSSSSDFYNVLSTGIDDRRNTEAD